MSNQPERDSSFTVDLNTADWPELIELPGIGPTLARRIIESRRIDGRFLNHEDPNVTPTT